MKRIIKNSIWGFVFCSILGTISHFIYDNVNLNFLGYITPINESVWEHLKMIYFPMLIFAVVEYFIYGKFETCFFYYKSLSIIVAMVFTLVFYYLYTGIVGKNVTFVDISSFFIALAVGYGYFVRKMQKGKICSKKGSAAAFGLLFVFLCLFFIFTVNPPNLPLFHE